MAEEKMISALRVYQTICDVLDNRDWHYDKDEEELLVHFQVSGDDVPIRIILVVDAKRSTVRLLSPMPFKMSEGKRVEGALACCIASYGLVDGNFDYNLVDGSINFRMCVSFIGDSEIGTGLIEYLIDCACVTVDKYNDQFLLINKDILSISDFMAKEDEE